ncbi:MAG: fumarate hydratase [Nitrospirae bacterium]|nr:fumarate hydratase [Nitrospirota bacterium]
MLKLRDGIVELFRKVATSIPPDVDLALRGAFDSETMESKETLSIILENITLARQEKKPVCQEFGVPVFWVRLPGGLSRKEISSIILKGTGMAVSKVPLAGVHGACPTFSHEAHCMNIAEPVIYYEQFEGTSLVIDLMLMGADCENAGGFHCIPAVASPKENAFANEALNEALIYGDLFNGVATRVTETILRAQGRGCPPYIVGIGIGGARDSAAALSKSQLLRKLNDVNPISYLHDMEMAILSDINRLQTGPIGLGGNTSALGVKIGVSNWHFSSNFVDISLSCWALRRGRLIWS